MEPPWKHSIYRQREELTRMLREPLALLAEKCVPVWSDRDGLNTVLLEGFSSIPYCTYLCVLGNDATQISDNINKAGILSGYFQRNRAERPCMKEAMPIRRLDEIDQRYRVVQHIALPLQGMGRKDLQVRGLDPDVVVLPGTQQQPVRQQRHGLR